MVSLALLALTTAAAATLPERDEHRPSRDPLATFPLQLGPWSGQREALEPYELDTLKLDDYVLADYARAGKVPVNFYVAWYDSQRSGQSAHSPRSCLPGGGWRITSLRRTPIAGLQIGGQPLAVNRALIELGEQRQVVYYWFQQRGRVVTNEYLVKWFIFRDALLRNRTDGALVRLVAPVPRGADESAADAEIQAFLATAVNPLARHVPQ
jgi:EpsI family protein